MMSLDKTQEDDYRWEIEQRLYYYVTLNSNNDSYERRWHRSNNLEAFRDQYRKATLNRIAHGEDNHRDVSSQKNT